MDLNNAFGSINCQLSNFFQFLSLSLACTGICLFKRFRFSNKTVELKQLRPSENQVAGHSKLKGKKDLLQGNGRVYKPLQTETAHSERYFYELSLPQIPKFKPFTPIYYGFEQIVDEEGLSGTPITNEFSKLTPIDRLHCFGRFMCKVFKTMYL